MTNVQLKKIRQSTAQRGGYNMENATIRRVNLTKPEIMNVLTDQYVLIDKQYHTHDFEKLWESSKFKVNHTTMSVMYDGYNNEWSIEESAVTLKNQYTVADVRMNNNMPRFTTEDGLRFYVIVFDGGKSIAECDIYLANVPTRKYYHSEKLIAE